MVIVCAVSDGYYLPALLTQLYDARMLSSSAPSSLSLSLSHYILFTLTLSVNLNVHVQSLSFAYYSTALPFFFFSSLLHSTSSTFCLLPLVIAFSLLSFHCFTDLKEKP